MNDNLFSVLVLQPLKLLFVILVIEAYTLKLRLKAAILGLQNRYLRFRVGQLIKRKRQSFAEYVRHRDLHQGITGSLKKAHIVGYESQPINPPIPSNLKP
jgi:hypothetical protein